MPAMPRWLRRTAFLAPFLAIGIATAAVPLPYYSLAPGPTADVVARISVDGVERNPSTGSLLLTAVALRQVTAVDLVLGWLDPEVAVLPAGEILPPGVSFEQERERAISDMDASKIDAASAALRLVSGYPRVHGVGALVRSVVPGCAAEGELYAGDRIVAVDGRSVGDVRDLERILEDRPSGETIRFSVLVDGRPEEASLVREPCGGSEAPIVGVALVDAFPFEIAISSGDIGGPSAGLMFALGLYELLGTDDLASGRTIAGTGEIGSRGRVYPIGGISQKIAAAERAGATIFLVPRGNLAEARATGTRLRLVVVDDLAGAVVALGGQPVG